MSVRKVYNVVVNGVEVFSGSYKAALNVYQSFVNCSIDSPETFSKFEIAISFNPLPANFAKGGLF